MEDERTNQYQADAGARQGAIRSFTLSSICSIGIYFVFSLYFTFVDYHAQPLIWNLILLSGLSLLTFCYWTGHKLLARCPEIGMRRSTTLALVASIVALAIPAFLSDDILYYINAGWQQYHYQENPYVHLICKIPGFGSDQMLSQNWSLTPFPYGFSFAHITRLLCSLGAGSLKVTVALFKLLNWCAYAALAVVLWSGAKRLRLKRPDLCLYLYLWSPLMLLHAISHGHNDILMMLFVMVGFLFAGTTLSCFALPALVAGGLVKYLWFYAIPLTSIYLVRERGWLAALASILLAVAAFFGLSWRYIWEWPCYRWEQLGINVSISCNSLTAAVHDTAVAIDHAFLHNPQRCAQALAPLMTATNVLLLGGFALFSAYFIFRSWQKREFLTFSRLIEITALAAIAWVSLVSPKFYPWYQVMFFPVALWLPSESEVRRLAIVLSCTQLLAFTFLGKSHISNYLIMTGAPLLWSLWRWLASKQSKRSVPSNERWQSPPRSSLAESAHRSD